MLLDAYIGIAEIHFEAEDYVNARANYEEAMYSTDDEEQKIEIYKKYQRHLSHPCIRKLEPDPSPRTQ